MIQRNTLRAAPVGLRGGLKILKLKTFTSVAACFFIFATVLPAEVYQYTGMNYTTGSFGSTYSGGEFVSGTFTFADPLAGGLTGSSRTGAVTSWTITDGVNTLCDPSCGAGTLV